jgi:fluoride exporter
VITYFWIALGSGLGGMARYGLSAAMADRFGEAMPWGTIVVNILGSFVIGFFAALTGPGGRVAAPNEARQFVTAGLCGGFTTFSAFSLQTLTLVQDGQLGRAGLNVGSSVVLCLIAVWLGYLAATAMNAARG